MVGIAYLGTWPTLSNRQQASTWAISDHHIHKQGQDRFCLGFRSNRRSGIRHVCART